MCVQASPAQVGDYIVLETIGTGATGKVKLGRHVRTGEFVALKFVRNNLIHSNALLFEKFRRETAVLKLISAALRQTSKQDTSLIDGTYASQSGVLQLLDVLHHQNAVVLVLEYCHNGELFDVLVREGFLSEPTVLDYFQQIVYALSFCHRRGVCHRDLKLENILLTHNNRIKIADFGMASLTFPGSFLKTSCGSPQYCSPEVMLGESYDGNTADVWSLGVILFAMTTGGLPFDDDNFQRLSAKIQSGSFYIPSEVPEGIAELITMMLVPDPAQRATLEDIKKSAWFNSKPCRSDIFIEEEDYVHEEEENDIDFKKLPISEPDDAILKQLADLGLGDIITIRRRLNNSERCKEKDYYRIISDFCSFVNPKKHGHGSLLSSSKELQITCQDVVALCTDQANGLNLEQATESMLQERGVTIESQQLQHEIDENRLHTIDLPCSVYAS